MIRRPTIIVVGSKGMLGQMVFKYFSANNYSVIEENLRITPESIDVLLNRVNTYENAYVINCVGKIKQKSTTAANLFWINTVYPQILSSGLRNGNILIQPSTDCVFNGLRESGLYGLNDMPDCVDDYGLSKYYCEQSLKYNANAIVVRVSIVGTDVNSTSGLLSWFLSRESHEVLSGFSNHLWNGITTLEWCKWAEKELINREVKGGFFQLSSSSIYSKFEMLMLFKKVFKKKITINKVTHSDSLNRCMEGIIMCESFENQLIELSKF